VVLSRLPQISFNYTHNLNSLKNVDRIAIEICYQTTKTSKLMSDRPFRKSDGNLSRTRLARQERGQERGLGKYSASEVTFLLPMPRTRHFSAIAISKRILSSTAPRSCVQHLLYIRVVLTRVIVLHLLYSHLISFSTFHEQDCNSS
jgi:hypothetical protein